MIEEGSLGRHASSCSVLCRWLLRPALQGFWSGLGLLLSGAYIAVQYPLTSDHTTVYSMRMLRAMCVVWLLGRSSRRQWCHLSLNLMENERQHSSNSPWTV